MPIDIERARQGRWEMPRSDLSSSAQGEAGPRNACTAAAVPSGFSSGKKCPPSIARPRTAGAHAPASPAGSWQVA